MVCISRKQGLEVVLLHSIRRIVETADRKLAKDFVDSNHSYINWADRPSRKLYWMLLEDGIMVGVFGLGSAFSKPKAVAEYMKVHEVAFNELGNNIVYCLAGHRDKNAGTKFLKLCRLDACEWWYERYGDELKMFQTFILPPRTGAVYKADNWTQLGSTTGGKSMTMRTLYGADIEKYPNAERRTFKSGEVKYLLRDFKTTEPKLIFMRKSRKATHRNHTSIGVAA
jgi:hypothetical protein